MSVGQLPSLGWIVGTAFFDWGTTALTYEIEWGSALRTFVLPFEAGRMNVSWTATTNRWIVWLFELPFWFNTALILRLNGVSTYWQHSYLLLQPTVRQSVRCYQQSVVGSCVGTTLWIHYSQTPEIVRASLGGHLYHSIPSAYLITLCAAATNNLSCWPPCLHTGLLTKLRDWTGLEIKHFLDSDLMDDSLYTCFFQVIDMDGCQSWNPLEWHTSYRSSLGIHF